MVSQHAAESSRAKLVTLSPTRWVERHESIIVMIEILDPPPYTLQEISTWLDTGSSSSAMVLVNSFLQTFFIISLCTLQTFLM
jgi:hypothetical protein